MEVELREASMMQRLLSGITSRGAGGNPIIAVDALSYGNDIFFATISGDHMVRLWSVQRKTCFATHALLQATEQATSHGAGMLFMYLQQL